MLIIMCGGSRGTTPAEYCPLCYDLTISRVDLIAVLCLCYHVNKSMSTDIHGSFVVVKKGIHPPGCNLGSIRDLISDIVRSMEDKPGD